MGGPRNGLVSTQSKNRNHEVPQYRFAKSKTFLMCLALAILSPTVNAWGIRRGEFFDAIANDSNNGVKGRIQKIDYSLRKGQVAGFTNCSTCPLANVSPRCVKKNGGYSDVKRGHLIPVKREFLPPGWRKEADGNYRQYELHYDESLNLDRPVIVNGKPVEQGTRPVRKPISPQQLFELYNRYNEFTKKFWREYNMLYSNKYNRWEYTPSYGEYQSFIERLPEFARDLRAVGGSLKTFTKMFAPHPSNGGSNGLLKMSILPTEKAWHNSGRRLARRDPLMRLLAEIREANRRHQLSKRNK